MKNRANKRNFEFGKYKIDYVGRITKKETQSKVENPS